MSAFSDGQTSNSDVSDRPILHIHLLGDFRLIYDDEPVTSINTPRLQSLLAYLVLRREAPQPRPYLAFLFWPDSTESQALTNLRHLLHLLRHALPDADQFIDIDAQSLQWHPQSPFTLDVARLERALDRAEQAKQAGDRSAQREALEEGIASYGGDLLPSCYDDWIRPERERLQQAHVAALEQLISLLEGRRETHAAIGYAQRLLRSDPLHETAYHQLMRLQALSGDRASALRTYHQCATTLQRELGVAPSPATREAYEQLLQAQTLPAQGGEPPYPARGGETQPLPPALIAAPSLVGRHREWEQIQNAWRIASAGQPRFVVVTGETGIGKTRLAEELARWAAKQGIATATTRCYAGEGALAYAPIVAWLRAHPLPPLAPVWRTEIARILPELLAEQPHLPPPGPLTEPWQRQRFFEALARALLGRTQPLLLLIDELQSCDQETIEWLRYLMRFDPRARLLVVGTVRTGEVHENHPLTSIWQTLQGSEQLNEVELEPLDKDSTAALAASVAQRELASDEIECLYRETEGNPLFVVETVRMGLSAQDQEPDIPAGARGAACLPRPLPAQMQAAIEGRLAQLSSPARELAELSATIGREFTFAVLRQATEMVEDTLVRALDELWRRRIVREQGADAYDFDHDKLREVAYASTSTARRHLLHRRVAQALEAVHQGNLDPVSAQVAAHYQRAGQPQRAIPYYQRAAQVARRVCANQEAKRHLQQALSLLEATPPTRAIDQWRRETLEVLHTSLGEVEELISQQCPTPGQDDKTRAEE